MNHEVRILCAYALKRFYKTAMILDVEVALLIGRQIGRTEVLKRAVGVPFYVCDFRIFGHQVVDNAENEVLHLWVGHVEKHLSASASQFQVASLLLKHPVGMFLEELALGVAALRLNPDAEVYA